MKKLTKNLLNLNSDFFQRNTINLSLGNAKSCNSLNHVKTNEEFSVICRTLISRRACLTAQDKLYQRLLVDFSPSLPHLYFSIYGSTSLFVSYYIPFTLRTFFYRNYSTSPIDYHFRNLDNY